MSKIEIKNKIKPNLRLEEPPMYKLIYLNDDVTTIEFVIETLVKYFEYSDENAQNITKTIHENGSAVVAVLPYELAEQKGIEITMEARSRLYPLSIKIESE